MKISQLGTDKKAETEGRWFTFRSDFKVKLAYSRSKQFKYEREVNRVLRKHRNNEEKQKDELMKLNARMLCLDWKGIEDDNDQPIPFSPDECYKLMKQLDPFSDWVAGVSANWENFTNEELDEDAGN